MKKKRIGGEREIRSHMSKEEKKRNLIIYSLICILIAIFFLVIIIMIPKGNKDKQADDAISKTDSSMIDKGQNTNTTSRIERDPNKVIITVDPTSLTEESGVITIVDKNDVPYTWVPQYTIEQKINGEWKEMERKTGDSSILSDIENENPTGTMNQSLVWVNKYGRLEPGVKYRIVKKTDGKEFYAEFVIR